ncbi:putative ATPase, AAA+ ATPase superfamily [Methanophagales archaeon]|nr:putative ATPase, AAA+ ATPase superfamily [Methanophagales archaeon]
MYFTLRPVKGERFINRQELLEEMISELRAVESTTGYALYGKRRIGKTSVLKEVQRRLESEHKIVTVYFSVWDLIEFSVVEFCQRLSMEIIDAYRPYIGLKYKAKELFQTPLTMLRKLLDSSELKIVYNELEFLISKKRDIDKNLLVENALYLPEKLAKCTGTKCILMIDEFPSISELKSDNNKIGETIIKKMRSIFENWERTTLCISGSIRSTMKLSVLSSTSPFYRQLIIKEVKPFEREYTKELLSSDIEITEEGVDEIHNFSTGIPFYVQFIGKMLERRKGSSVELIKELEAEFLLEEGDILFKEEFDILSSKERLIAINIAKGCHTPKAIASAVGDNISNVNQFLTYLEQKGYVLKREKGYYILEDPVFARWLEGL